MNKQQLFRSSGTQLLMAVIIVGPLSALATNFSLASDLHLKQTALKRLAPNDVLFTEDVLLEVWARSRIDCSKKCVETEGCAMCTFLSSPQGPPGHCRLHSQLQNRTDGWQNAAGAESWARRGGCDGGGYVLTCGRCLKAVDSRVKYQDAQRNCSQMQGRLVMPKTSSEVDCVWSFLMTNNLGKAWAGADDQQEPGVFRWNDGTLLPDNSPLWDSQDTEPDKKNPGNDCLNLRDQDSNLFDSKCDRGFGFICQKDFV